MANNVELGKSETLKKELFQMEAKRKEIENELTMHRIVLDNNNVGMSDKLVDDDDFPRGDIDVWAVKQARSAIIKLENDAKDLFARMQSKLEELHSLSKPNES